MTAFPFRDDDVLLNPDIVAIRRLKQVRDFVTDGRSGRLMIVDECLDCGDRNWLIQELFPRARWTHQDLNLPVIDIPRRYATITAFEVLEHLVNPAVFVTGLKKILDDRGRIYLSTPIAHPLGILQSEHHFAEYRLDALRLLFDYCGLTVRESWIWHTYPLASLLRPSMKRFPFYSVRGILRRLLSRTVVFDLRKKT